MQIRHYSVRRAGRRISWWERGSGESVVIYCHGTPGGGLEAVSLRFAEFNDARVIALDRPGYGGTDRMRGRTVADWVSDLMVVLEERDVDCFGVLGYSGGGPHALAAAHHLPRQVTSIGLIAPAAPHTGLRAGFEVSTAWLRMVIIGLVTRFFPERLLGAVPGKLGLLLVRSHGQRREALAPGIGGAVDDEIAITSRWGFTVAEAAAGAEGTPAVVWLGERDRIVHPREGAGIAKALGARLVRLPEIGHAAVLAYPGIVDEVVRLGRV